jgi:hypothetical protein
MNKTIILKVAVYISGFLCLYGLVAIRYQPLYNLVLKEKTVPGYWDKNKYGELYYFNNIKYFREDIPPALPKFQFSDKHSPLEEAEILTFGDSNMDFSRNVQLSAQIKDSMNMPVFFEYTVNPIKFLKTSEYKNKRPKILLYTRTERWIPIDFLEEPITEDIYMDFTNDIIVNERPSYIKSLLTRTRDIVFNNRADELLRAMLQRSYIVSDINTFISTRQFDWFGYISSYTPKYSLDDKTPWLFNYDQLNDEVTSFYYQFSDEEIEKVSENIKKMSDHLWNEYRLQLIFMPVPAKYTIYHYIVEPDAEYNNFLPRLYENLTRLNVDFIDLYEPYNNSEEYVFYGTDDHWTEEGGRIAAREVVSKIRKLNMQFSWYLAN